MTLDKKIQERSGNQCELCGATAGLTAYEIPAGEGLTAHTIATCETCNEQLLKPETADPNHWRCLNDSMWSETDGVKVIAYRMLTQLKHEGWPQDLLDMMYLEDELLSIAKAGIAQEETEGAVVHKDSNGATLTAGDTVVIIKDLDVKGTSLTAKRGTAVRNITLVHDNPEHIEGRVNGQQIVILTKFVKKQ